MCTTARPVTTPKQPACFRFRNKHSSENITLLADKLRQNQQTERHETKQHFTIVTTSAHRTSLPFQSHSSIPTYLERDPPKLFVCSLNWRFFFLACLSSPGAEEVDNERNDDFPPSHNLLEILFHLFIIILFLQLHCPTRISPMGCSACFPRGKPAATGSRYPCYSAC